jgi:formylglycine-generating enzyme required for sulfatase activity
MPDLFYRNAVDGYEMVLVPAGKAVFGSRDNDPDALDREKPQFAAELPDYYLGLYCVTNAQYAAFLSAAQPSDGDLEKWVLLDSDCHVVRSGSGYRVDDGERYGDHPVVQVSWYGAEAYCEWAGLRLPSELEWEKGARGTEGEVYPWGNEWKAEYCRHAGNRGSERTCRVWEYPDGVSVWGCYNMSGNVWEWCADWHAQEVYKSYAKGDLRPPSTGSYKVVRGGSWLFDFPRYFRAANRSHSDPSYRYYALGFRCARGL